MIRRSASAAAVLALGTLVAPTAAGATGSYPGETLALGAPANITAGQAVTLTASGSQTDVDGYAGGFDLEVFAKDPAVDPTCASSFTGEMTTYLTESSTEQRIAIGLWQGPDTSFDLPVKVVFDHPGPVLLCAYSEWVTDTAAAAQLTVDVAGGTPTPPPPPPPLPPTTTTTPPPAQAPPSTTPPAASAQRPAIVQRPRIARHGGRLSCSRGTWANGPTTYAFSWRVDGRLHAGAHAQRLAITARLRSHVVSCAVTARNAAGAAAATSAGYRVP
jgi:hypothetical protein